jgi:hypothetical protein
LEEEEEIIQTDDEGSQESDTTSSGKAIGASRYLENYANYSDDSDSQQHTVESTCERHNEEMVSTLEQIHNAI